MSEQSLFDIFRTTILDFNSAYFLSTKAKLKIDKVLE